MQCYNLRAMRKALVFLFGLLVSPAACSSSSSSTGNGATSSMFVVPNALSELDQLKFFDHPFPSDVRREADGSVRFDGWPNPQVIATLVAYIDATHGLLKGFSPVAPTYLRFTGSIDTSTLPADPGASLAPDASVQIIDVDPASPEHGKRHLAQTRWQETEGIYWPSHTLGVMPMIGAPLRTNTKYAVVVTSKLKAPGGVAIGRAPDLDEVLGTASTRTKATHDVYAPAVADVIAAGIAVTDIVHLAVFTTNDPTAETYAAMDDVVKNVAPPTTTDWTAKEQSKSYDTYEGNYGPSPNYQTGTSPYTKPSDGGSFTIVNGSPVVQNTFNLRFALTVPHPANCPVPAQGYPVVLYAHGTGGDYRSFIDDGTADALGSHCLAGMGIDQIFHGTRPGSPPANDPNRDSEIELLFFNFDNPLAARTGNRQAAIDLVQQARVFTASKTSVPANVSRTAAQIDFDPSNVMFFGHSQGGLNGPLFFAGSHLARGGVLSGAGADIRLALLEKSKPVDVAGIVRIMLHLNDEDGRKEFDVFSPALTLVQSIIDVADPVHYARNIITAPRPGNPSKSVFQTEGVDADGTGDNYAPPHNIETLSVAMGVPRVAPGIHTVVEASFVGLSDVTIPADGLTGNLAAGQATGILAQFTPKTGSDGHFVVFDIPAARNGAAQFCANLAVDPVGKVPSLQ